MTATGWQSVDLLTRFNRLSGRPATDAVTPATKYGYLADAEQYVIGRIAAIKPSILYGVPTALTTADGGLTFTFGTDGNGYPLFPMGRATIYPSLNAIPGGAWVAGRDYLDEGATIRMPNAVPYTGTLYMYGITPTQQISADVQPMLQPPPIRMLDVLWAVKTFAEAGFRNTEMADRMELRFEREFGQAMLMLRKHFATGGGLGRLLYPFGVSGAAA
jgi:hypothetical protein